MYSGSTLTTFSGKILGAHQKIDRVARRHVELLMPGCAFPAAKLILHFEGGNGPDAIKRKSPAHDEPWHYIQPFDEQDTQLIELITEHYHDLITALKARDDVRSAFEAAWLAHAIVDGLTPAHHYPYEEKIVELLGGQSKESRNTVLRKIVFPGDTLSQQAHNNWQYWGAKGVFTTHTGFEWGFATLIKPLPLKNALPSDQDRQTLTDQGIAVWFRTVAQEVAGWKLYDSFYASGWSPKLTKQIRRQLAPAIVRAVTVAWLGALEEAQLAGPRA